jgi:cysteine-rich repeat protein
MSTTSGETIRGAVLAAALFGAAITVSGCIAEPEARTCSTGIYCPAGSRCAARQPICIIDNCGDGILQQGEACDDGNKQDGDGCSADCKSNETCGNKIVDEVAGEVCDDENNIDGDGCSADCKSLEGCGNGIVDPGEDCDSGPSGTPNQAKETPLCTHECKWAACGDGIVNQPGGVQEECDEGKANNSYDGACLPDCRKAICGDGHVNNGAEDCDDGPDSALTKSECPYGQRGCTVCSGCKLVGLTSGPYCGDTITNGPEVCDDGASRNGATFCPTYGQQSCDVCSSDCSQLITRPAHYCGDGTRTATTETPSTNRAVPTARIPARCAARIARRPSTSRAPSAGTAS